MTKNEHELESAVESGELSEEQALRLLPRIPKPRHIKNVDRAYNLYEAKELREDEFYTSLLCFVEMMVKQSAEDDFTFTNIEDVISETLIELWQRLPFYKRERGSFRAFAMSIVRSNIRDTLRKWQKDRGFLPHEEIDEETFGAALQLSIENRLVFNEWLNGLEPIDRKIADMVMDGAPLREVADEIGLSHEGVRQRILSFRLTNPPKISY